MGFMGWDGIGWDAPANASLRFPSAAPAPALSRPAAVRASPQVNVTAGGADSLVTAMCMKALPDWFAFGSARGSESPHTHHPRTHNHAHTRCSLQACGRRGPPSLAATPSPLQTPPQPCRLIPVAVSRDKYYCLPSFDVQGWPAGQGPPAEGGDDAGPPKAPVTTDFSTNTEPTICAGQCSSTQARRVGGVGCSEGQRPPRAVKTGAEQHLLPT